MIDLDGFEVIGYFVAEPEICLAAGLGEVGIFGGNDHLRAGQALQFSHAGDVVVMATRGGKDLRVGKFEAELFDACLDLRDFGPGRC